MPQRFLPITTMISQIHLFCDLSDDIPAFANLAIGKINLTNAGVVRARVFVPQSNPERNSSDSGFNSGKVQFEERQRLLALLSVTYSSKWNGGGYPAFGRAAGLQDFSRSTLVVSPEVKVQPRRSAIQLPQTRRNAVGNHFLWVSRIGQTFPGPEPHALPFRVHLTAAVSTATAGAIADVFRALGLRTKKRYVLDSTISAAPAFKQKCFNRVLKQLHQKPAGDPLPETSSHQPKDRCQ